MAAHILVVDDEQDMTRLLKRTLEIEFNCHVTMAFSGETAVNILARESFDLMLCDIKMPGMDGFELLRHTVEHYPDLTVLMLTAFGSIDVAIKAIKSGAYDFVSKPFEQDEILFRVKKALERGGLIKENKKLHREKSATFGKLIGESPAMQEVYDKISMVAQSDVTVLITGESGTGKDLTAQSIHALSQRKKKKFIPVNCPTVPEAILESELFGYKKGAFTNAMRDKSGLFQEAHEGTIFLDEIGDIGPTIQTKLLRVLQEKEVKPLGDTRSRKVDVRIVASTNRNLARKIEKGEFREDFFYRLSVFTITLPPLRDRITDIPPIACHLVEKHCKKLNKTAKKIDPALMDLLLKQHWQGNVRELENMLIQGILHSDGDTISPSHMDLADQQKTVQPPFPDTENLFKLPYKEAKEQLLQQFNHNYIGTLLSLTGGNVTQAARQCGLERQALQQIMKRFTIKADTYR
ncbi:DNA-binding transcriptional response regulator, NtrC family, contains REC, AAA-type ATPase, and a Fis-type DNA-binding domains [Desulfocicer vacuolatum DSM 3385]|uniref:DNA-binding transcriptional response regulator, NtrC family, contains REC, AAA-type ATPase, and a Fis-type DNA-binding domains n=1 Tax=Desulfocicer vacuolatum DSM 3385 TaxID=1121400 RepID=A0A1W1YMY3_9BACT|nr:sigma-54 dependent transcriptional regulator [Desulfocicer vacuolatum]SMC37483.1 DNA-binding transcriptional response regulator, NtrC family, contains REC, AAA-type ATPase, and a Fis-type DNA-binding domains [Desulfocicer vacuolatum DSM 3385]